MIIGAILETSINVAGTPSSGQNGSALVVFYTWNDAINWATEQSRGVTFGTGNSALFTLCTITNTDTSEKRWWYQGIEYTG